jgi:hypothetical protein
MPPGLVFRCRQESRAGRGFCRPATLHCPVAPCRRLFAFTRLNNKSLGGADLSMMASNVVLSALSILPYEQAGRTDADPAAAHERAQKMAAILGFSATVGVRGGGAEWAGGARTEPLCVCCRGGLCSAGWPAWQPVWHRRLRAPPHPRWCPAPPGWRRSVATAVRCCPAPPCSPTLSARAC